MASVIQVYNRDGQKLGELYQDVNREWLLNDYGEAEFNISVVEEKTRLSTIDLRQLLEFGNLVYIPNTLVGDWAGVITRRVWKKGILQITCKSLEYIFSFGSVLNEQTYNANPGTIFTKLLQKLNSQTDYKINQGEVYTGGDINEEPFSPNSILSQIARMADDSNEEFGVSTSIEENKLLLYANWYKYRSIETDLHLIEGHNLSAPDGDLLNEDGSEITNVLVGYSDMANGEQISKKAIDDTSIAQYGERWGSYTFTNVKNSQTLLNKTKEMAKRTAKPFRGISGRVLNIGDLFPKIRLGNQATIDLYTAGFKESGLIGTTLTGRIIGARYIDKTDSFDIVLEEVIE